MTFLNRAVCQNCHWKSAVHAAPEPTDDEPQVGPAAEAGWRHAVAHGHRVEIWERESESDAWSMIGVTANDVGQWGPTCSQT